MKSPLHYQVSEFDCGPATLMNMVLFLYERKEVPQDVISKIYEITLDGYKTVGIEKGKHGTSDEAMIRFADWISSLTFGSFAINSEIIAGSQVKMESGGIIEKTLASGGAVVAKVHIGDPHYVLFTGVDPKKQLVYLFDPYYRNKQFRKPDLLWTQDHPGQYNCVVPYAYFNRSRRIYYAFGKEKQRLCVLYHFPDSKEK